MDLITVKGFKKAFKNKVIHKDISFTLKKGECLGLIGGSGTGKSVLLRSLIGLESADEGQILINDKDVTRYTEEQWLNVRQHVAYAFQGGALFDSLTVFDNLAYPLREHTKLSEPEILNIITSKLLEFGLNGNETNYPSQLSGGMQKRLGLARAIINNPKVILYDEPTAGLDPFNTKKIGEMILRLKTQGVSSILVTHDMPVAFKVCDRIAILSNGEIAAIGTIAELEQNHKYLISGFVQGDFYGL